MKTRNYKKPKKHNPFLNFHFSSNLNKDDTSNPDRSAWAKRNNSQAINQYERVVKYVNGVKI